MNRDELLAALWDASSGLLYPSESDEPFEAFAWPVEAGETATAAVGRHDAKRPVEEQSVQTFFDDLKGSDDAPQFAKLRDELARQLEGVTVVRAGEIEVNIYLIGRALGMWAGLRTMSVET